MTIYLAGLVLDDDGVRDEDRRVAFVASGDVPVSEKNGGRGGGGQATSVKGLTTQKLGEVAPSCKTRQSIFM